MIDTVKLSYPVRHLCPGDPGWGGSWDDLVLNGWKMGKRYGSSGPCSWQEWVHDETDTRIVIKGVRGEPHMLWEGSVPKFLGIEGAAPVASIKVLDRYLRTLFDGGVQLPNPAIRRIDLTYDFKDPDGLYRQAARGWSPHARSRYIESVFNDGETVFLYNKSRGVRVYDKEKESGEDWAAGLTRLEYQMRGDWCGKNGLNRLHGRMDEMVGRALMPLVEGLERRVADITPDYTVTDRLRYERFSGSGNE